MPDAAPVQYVRLPGRGLARKGLSFVAASRSSCRLWLGDDHLLQVESMGGYSEGYKRFYFRDIQVFYLHRTRSWFVNNIVLGLLTVLFLLFAWVVGETGGTITLGVIAGLFGFFMVVNLLRGPTCRCFLKTAVHLEELPSLRRRRNAEKVLARLQPLIEAAQGAAAAETIAPQYQALLASAHALAATPGQITRLADPAVSVYRGRSHQWLFITLLVAAVPELLNIFLPCSPVVFLEMIVSGILAVTLIASLVKQQQTDLKPAVRLVTWITAAAVAISYIVGYVVMFLITAGGHNTDGTQWGYIRGVAELRPLETTWFLVILSVTAAVHVLLGVTGLLFLQQHWREKEIAA
ncbi:MAG TPA: hypothetical protein VG347_23900 [Verrucomicrobiae bacterium]|nr:hypothetical protein [Verrucomicrobiae bacterium]